MRRIIFGLCVITVFTFYFSQVAWADELSSLKKRIKELEDKLGEKS